MSGLLGDNWAVTADGNNRLSNLTYDSAGEVTLDQFGNAFSYDAEGRLLSAGGGTYVYDGDGNRVKKTASSTTTLYWPGAGAVLDESNSSGTSMGKQVAFAGLLVWHEDMAGTGNFLFQDHLGSTRVTGSASGALADDNDYLPFGRLQTNYGAAPSDNHYQFTGYESDASESNTDYADFRNLSYSMGRFNRPDPYDGSYDPSNPQSLNRYSYTLNNPMSFTDPSGLEQCGDEDDCGLPGSLCDANGCTFVQGGRRCIAHCGIPPGPPDPPPSKPPLPTPTTITFSLGYGLVTSVYSQNGGGGGGGGGAAPNKPGILHRLACAAGADAFGLSKLTGHAAGFGAGVSAGVGLIPGIFVSGGYQAVADPHGNEGLAFTGSISFLGIGFGGQAGRQISLSTATTINDLRGTAMDFNGSAGLVGLDVSHAPGGATTGTVTIGPAPGTKTAVVGASHTWIPFSTDCSDVH